MNKNQWFVLGLGATLLGTYLLWDANLMGFCNAMILNDEQMTACFIRRYATSIPGKIIGFMGILFMICAAFEKRK